MRAINCALWADVLLGRCPYCLVQIHHGWPFLLGAVFHTAISVCVHGEIALSQGRARGSGLDGSHVCVAGFLRSHVSVGFPSGSGSRVAGFSEVLGIRDTPVVKQRRLVIS